MPGDAETKTIKGGLVVIFDGSDGVGKTTQLELARAELEKDGWSVMATRNMGGTPIGEALREVIKSPLDRPPMTDFYISLAVQEPLLDVIDKARAEGRIILMDRSPLSLAAYQIYGSGVDAGLGWRHVDAAMRRIGPDAVILYDMDPQEALSRVREAGQGAADYFENKPSDYFEKVAEGFDAAAERYPATRVDAAESIASVHEKTMAAIRPLLGLAG